MNAQGSWRGREAGAALPGLYARVAAVLLAAVTATGVWGSLRRMPAGTVLDQLTTTAYGRTLPARVLLVAAGLALWARRRRRRAADPLTAYAPRAGRGGGAGGGGRGVGGADGAATADQMDLIKY